MLRGVDSSHDTVAAHRDSVAYKTNTIHRLTQLFGSPESLQHRGISGLHKPAAMTKLMLNTESSMQQPLLCTDEQHQRYCRPWPEKDHSGSGAHENNPREHQGPYTRDLNAQGQS
jgi:hypothetical protein